MFAHAIPELLERTRADEHTVTVFSKRYYDPGNPFFYFVGSQCFKPSGSDIVSLNEPKIEAGPNVKLSE